MLSSTVCSTAPAALDLGARRRERRLAVLEVGDVVVPGKQRALALVFDRVHRVERPPRPPVGAPARDLDVAHAALGPRALEQAGTLVRIDEQRGEVDAGVIVAGKSVLPCEFRIAEQEPAVLDCDGGADRAALEDRAHAMLALLDPLLVALALRDVAVDRDEAAARQRIVADLQHGAVRSDALGRVVLVGARDDLVDDPVDVGAAVFAASCEVVDEVRIGRAAGEEIGRQVEHFLEATVARRELARAVEHRDTMGHVVEHDGHDVARALVVAPGRSRLGLGALQLLPTLMDLSNVAGRADHAPRAPVRAAQDDAVLARPAHRAVRHAVAEFAVEARDVALEQREQLAAMIRPVVRMDAVGPLLQRSVGRQAQHGEQRRREIERAGDEVPVVDVLADRLQRERVALLVAAAAVAERERGAVRGRGRDGHALVVLDLGHVAGRADQAERASVGVALRDAALACPAPGAVVAAIAGVAFETRRQAFEVLGELVPIERQVVRMHARHPVGGRRELGLVQPEHDSQLGRVGDGAGLDVPVVDAVVERLQRQQVALLGRRQPCGRGARRLAARALTGRKGARCHQDAPSRVSLAGPCIVGISLGGEFVSFVSRSRRACAKTRSKVSRDATLT